MKSTSSVQKLKPQHWLAIAGIATGAMVMGMGISELLENGSDISGNTLKGGLVVAGTLGMFVVNKMFGEAMGKSKPSAQNAVQDMTEESHSHPMSPDEVRATFFRNGLKDPRPTN